MMQYKRKSAIQEDDSQTGIVTIIVVEVVVVHNQQSQLHGGTTVVMATHGLHGKCQSLTPCQKHPSESIEKIFGTIDNVIDLNNLDKFGFEQIFPDGGTHAQHMRVRLFFFLKKRFTFFDEDAAKTAISK